MYVSKYKENKKINKSEFKLHIFRIIYILNFEQKKIIKKLIIILNKKKTNNIQI